MKRFYVCTLVLALVLGILAYFSYPYIKPLNVNKVFENYKETKNSKEVREFVENKLSRKDGAIYTNYLNEENKGDETKGHYILSESQGLLMEYALMTNNEELFNKAYNIIKEYMILDNGLISWRISKDNEKNTTSALIDELRIARCFIEAYEKFDKFKYKVDAVNLSKAILKNSSYNNMVIDFNNQGQKSNLLTLCYIDITAFDLLSNINDKWKEISFKGSEIVNKGYISDTTPLYRKNFNLDSNKYSEEKENELLYSLMVWENLIKIGKSPEIINDWMAKQIKKYGCLYTKYSIKDNTPVDYIESTSIYAVAYRISLKGNDKEFQDKLYKNLMKYQIKTGELKGGFGMEKTKEAYSFDNLEAMISLISEI